jgi:hypothetical protein
MDHPTEIKFEDYSRLLWKLAHRFYKRIPASFRNSVDVEDLYAIGAEHFLYTKDKFEKRRGKRQPFPKLLTYSVSRRLQDVLKGMSYQKRRAVVVSYDDPDEYVYLPCIQKLNPGARERVDRFYALASDELQETLTSYVFGGKLPDRMSSRVFSHFQAEVKWLSARTSVTVEDFLFLLK